MVGSPVEQHEPDVTLSQKRCNAVTIEPLIVVYAAPSRERLQFLGEAGVSDGSRKMKNRIQMAVKITHSLHHLDRTPQPGDYADVGETQAVAPAAVARSWGEFLDARKVLYQDPV